KSGETLFLVLEHANDFEKPSLLAKLFAAYVHGVITESELRRLAHAMDGAFTDDLNDLLAWDDQKNPSHAGEWMENLVGSGFARVRAESGYDDVSVRFELTALARLLKRAIEHVESKG